ncbi:MAG: CHAD domain-containing protein [Ignavibacteria bacterium]|nr:CHAD domain-containing protein [Ignavibacteria bacterium]
MAKAKKIPGLDPNHPLDVSLLKILRTRFDEMTAHEQGTIDGSDIEALHDMRVASRRVQAVFKMFRGIFPKKKFKTEYNELRLLIRSLGEVRDYDVFIDKTEKLKNELSDKDTRAIDLLIIRKKAEREQKRKLLIQHINTLNKAEYKEHFSNFITENLS